MLTATSRGGTIAKAYDEGQGRPILLLHPGLDDGRRNKKLARILAKRFRVVRLHRRQYRLDLKADPKLGSPCTIADEVDHALAIVSAIGEPVVLYGHSDGAVVALEALVGAPASFTGAVIFEPPVVIDPRQPIGGPGEEILHRARAALARGRPGKALAIFTHDAVGMPRWYASIAGLAVAALPRYRKLASCQLDSLEAIDQLGVRLDAYSSIEVPTVLLGGGSKRNPAHIASRLDALQRAMPHAERVVMPKRDHTADVRAPEEVAGVIEALADRVTTG
jgi:pimeloyl-ACP methyl ester carboxylesterase